MPSTMTHSYFAYDIYKKISNKDKISNIENFKLYCQGTDPFMFYNYLIGKKNKYYCKIQNITHTTKTKDYFINIIKYIIENNLTDNKEVITFLYGNICHYFLDLKTHPFIYYKTGKFNKKDKNTYKYNTLHQDMEYSIDKYLIIKNNTKTKNFKIHKEIFNNYYITKEVTDCLKYTIKKTYNIKISGKEYKKSVKMMKRFFHLFNYDKFGIKKRIYCLIDKITPPNTIKIEKLAYNYKNINIDYLNLSHKKWNHPSIKNEIYYDSFFDLYNSALNEALEAINVVNDCLAKKKIDYKKINKVFKNLSAVTGKDCNLNLPLKYFEF